MLRLGLQIFKNERTKGHLEAVSMGPAKGALFFALLFVSAKGFGQTASEKNTQDPTGFQHHVELSENFLKNNLDSALFHALAAESLIAEHTDNAQQIKVWMLLGDVYTGIGDMDKAMDRLLRAKVLNDIELERNPGQLPPVLKKSDIFLKIGVLHFYLRSYEKSLLNCDEALKVIESIQTQLDEKEMARRKVKIFNNMAAVYIHQSDFEKALSYFQNALQTNQTSGDENVEGSLLNNIGICYLEKREADLANHYFLKALDIRTRAGDKRGEAQVLNNLGKNQVYQGNLQEAQKYYQQALSTGREIGHGESTLISLESLAKVYDDLGEYKNALNTYKEYKALNDSIFSLESNAAIANLEEKYRKEKEVKVLEIEARREEAERQRSQMLIIAIAGALFFLLLTAFLLIVLMRGKLKNGRLEQAKLQLEHQNLELERRTLQENLEYKERELTANALFLLKNNELIARITENLLKAKSTFKQENQQIIQDIIRELQSSQDKHNWNEFEAHFTRVHAQFYQSLQEKFPTLTINEKKLCAFLRLNMSTKDISAITYQSVNSITVARSRLRKKLNIEGEDIQLINFLMSV